MDPYPSPPRAPPDLTPPGTPRGRYKIPPHLTGGQISKNLPAVSSTEGKGDLLSPHHQKESLDVQQETSILVQNILEEVERDLLESQSSEPKHQTLDPEQPDNSIIGLPVQGAARAPLAKFCNFLAGSFSAVSKRNFARKYAFDSIFQALQDLHPFAPLQSQIFRKKSV